jgi:hypothetical protein
MGLILYVFGTDLGGDEEPEELAECQVGHYSDFACFRNAIEAKLDASKYPLLMQHSDCDGEWACAELALLEKELNDIARRFKELPPEEPENAFEHTAEHRIGATSLYDCFHDVDGENLFKSILKLCAAARENNRPITFM